MYELPLLYLCVIFLNMLRKHLFEYSKEWFITINYGALIMEDSYATFHSKK